MPLTAPRASRRSSVFVELTGRSAADASARTGGSRRARIGATKARRSAVRAQTSDVVEAARRVDPDAQELFAVSNAVPGLGLYATPTALRALAARRDVVKISTLTPKTPSNAGVAQLVKAVNAWQRTGRTGAGVKVGVIDTGIDYTHADFGGAGTVAAYEAARKTSTAAFAGTPKVVGGHDFVGDDYNVDQDADSYQPVPHPDPNPLDCEGHGTHVAGTLAGYGVTGAGSTFRGDYSALSGDKLDAMKIGPGMAPGASLYGLRVFGCEGSTDEVIPALDWALDPDGDGDFSDHLDIVNLSLGSDYVAADDPENTVVDALAAHGVLSVISAGNNGDLTDTGGAPGNAVRALTVASSVDAFQLRDALRVEAPADLAGTTPVQFSLAYPWSSKTPVTADVAVLGSSNADGCDPLSPSDKARVGGRAAWLVWDDNDATRRCGSAARSANVAAAGAVGAVFTSTLDVFAAGITGSAVIPVVQLPRGGTDRLAPAATAGTLRVTFDGGLRNSAPSVVPSIADTLSGFSSRGTHGAAPGVVKPDVAAPGDSVASALVGSGNDVQVESGTSMAAPATAGIAALVQETHPLWSPEQIKADVMNTATHDVFTEPNRKGRRYGPARVGSGRVDALAAVESPLLMYATRDGAVGASFGVVEVKPGKTVRKRRTMVVENTGGRSAKVRLSYRAGVKQRGVSYSVSPKTVRVKAHRTTKVTVTMRVRGSRLRRTIDPTMARTQTDAYLGVDRARQYLPDASGRLVARVRGLRLRAPVYGAAKPYSTTEVRPEGSTLRVSGRGVDQGSGLTAYGSKLSVLDLAYTSPRQPVCSTSVTTGCTSGPSTRSGDLQHVGASSFVPAGGTPADGYLWFGLSMFSDWATLNPSAAPYVDLDVDRDGTFDYEVYVQPEDDTDLLTAFLVDYDSGELVGLNPVNFADGDVDTNPFDTSTVLVPVDLAAIGVTSTTTSFPIRFQVGTLNALTSSPDYVQDSSPVLSYDAVNPTVRVAGPLYEDRKGARIPFTSTQAGAQALVLHLGGRSGHRTEVLSLPRTVAPTTTSTPDAAAKAPVGGDRAASPARRVGTGRPVSDRGPYR